ncbi:MAG TPA: DinB family protein [Mucilaginibacter sp.]
MKAAIISQYHAALTMLTDTMQKCPNELWIDDNYDSAYWRIVYHALFYTDLYLSESVESFIPWDKHRPDYNQLGRLNEGQSSFKVYPKDELMAYAELVANKADTKVNEESFEDASGFPWLKMTKFELQLYNIRHIQHHTGQLIERLHQNGINGIDWKGRG